MENALPHNLLRALRYVTPPFYDKLWMVGPRNRPIIKAITKDRGFVVQSGPFAGMHYIRHSIGSALAPKLIGCYESELHDIVDEALSIPFDRVIDIGCGEGYYVVGCARRLPQAQVYAYDIAPLARELCHDLASINGVTDRVILGGRCTLERLSSLTEQAEPENPILVICDCEGCELDLLQPDSVPGLTRCHLLVELHDAIVPGVSTTIVRRFATTHDTTIIDSTRRNPGDYSTLSGLDQNTKWLAVTEARPSAQQWAWMEPLSGR